MMVLILPNLASPGTVLPKWGPELVLGVLGAWVVGGKELVSLRGCSPKW